ncbi:LpxL/LpxP family acyltransferase [Gluconobacter oxydans]|uniref:Acyltransferase n=2 Tax=Gluconobacter oxydans TaxID=442 RepID=Q5FR51_GLUOX|nr:acyltransferase [Gluconobacter oxydans]AAW61145.1 Acyltransferase [Gluconobacter oxydans 621H]KXV34893.1 acyltransferase [Gluconobacter oxydans]MBF0857336.1 acyltransferase [Gluconobacter oxydans]TCW21831.1 putative LPLAT superfamily acyltransferase [Gluconobacter oxydans]GEC61912.1 acyltransferase [Gluconobacter oxydans]
MTAEREAWLVPERGNRFVMKLMLGLARLFGRRRLALLLYPISLWYLATDGTARRNSRIYLRRVLGREPSLLLIWHHIRSYAQITLDRLFILDPRATPPEISLAGAEILFEALEAGRGCLLLGAHIGSFDSLRTVLRVMPAPLTLRILMYRRYTGEATRLIEMLDPAYTDILIPLGEPDTMLRVAESLRAGSVVAILGDRAHDMGRSLSVSVLGKPALLPVGPIRLAALTGAPVVLFSGLRRPDGSYDIRFEKFAERIEFGETAQEKAASLKAWMTRYADWMSALCRRDPLSWYNYYDFWKERT